MDMDFVFSQLIRIKDLDIWEGLAHIGCSQEEYIGVLRIFCTDLEKKRVELDEFVKKENWKGYFGTVHAIKGGLAGIGAWRLSEKVEELENAARNKDYQFCMDETGNVLKEMEQFFAALKSSALFTEEKEEREQVSVSYMEKKLNELYLYCSLGSSAEAEDLAKELKSKTCGSETDTLVNEICAHVKNFDYDMVLQILDEQPYIKGKVG